LHFISYDGIDKSKELVVMNYDKLILELFSRVQILEEQVAEVNKELADLREEDADDEFEEEIEGQGGYTRSEAREKAMEIIQDKFPDYLVNRASRKDGSGITAHRPNESKPRIIKFYHSRTFKHSSGKYEHGWHVVRLDDVIGTIVDYCMLSMVDSNDNWYFFIFNPEELGRYKEKHRSRSGSVLHLYFSVQDGRAFEVREDTVDVTEHLNNWGVLDISEA
jgi:hypothetical protein